MNCPLAQSVPGALIPVLLVWAAAVAPTARAETAADELSRALAGAEESLRRGEVQVAESRYRDLLGAGWRILGELAAREGRTGDALAAFQDAIRATVDHRRASTSLALLEIEVGREESAVRRLQGLLAEDPEDLATRRLLAAALIAAGRPEQALQELEEIRAREPEDPELAYSLGAAYLGAGQPEAAERLFAEVVRRRPIAATHVLLGRTYRDRGHYERAERELHRALELDPAAPRAHFYLGTLHLLEGRRVELEEAISHFRRELEVSPGDPTTHLFLGMALVESRRPEEAVDPLRRAAAETATAVDGNLFLGRALLAADRPEEAAAALRRALAAVAEAPPAEAGDERLRSLHYQLGLALRRTGDREGSTFHLEAAQRLTEDLTEESRGALQRFIEGEPEYESRWTGRPGETAFGGLDRAERDELRRGVEGTLARAYLNLGILQARSGNPGRAAGLVERAAGLDPELPGVHRALGALWFDAGEHRRAVGPLTGALADSPDDGELRRMLGLAHLEAGDPAAAAELLGSVAGPQGDDAGAGDDPSLLYAHALALVRSGRVAEAESAFADLLLRHGDSARVHVLVGEAHAAENDFDAAVRHFRRALDLDPDVAHARPGLGVIHLRRGDLEAAEGILAEELARRPGDVRTRFLLATVLDLRDRTEAAAEELRQILVRQPGHVEARYLLGKVLLGQGATGEALALLETAVELAPGDARFHYQLGRAYQAAGRREEAQEQFQRFRELKAAERGGDGDGDGVPPEGAP